MLKNQNPHIFSVPSKIFLLGEYVVLKEKPGIVAALEPKFSLSISKKEKNNNLVSFPFHSESPAGKFFSKNKDIFSHSAFEFYDPFKGGFGGSSAEFVLLWAILSDSQKSMDAYQEYRSLFDDQKITPSGFDVLVQIEGGILWCHPSEKKIEHLEKKSFPWSQFLIFSATQIKDQKVKTHEHLASNSLIEKMSNEIWLQQLSEIVQKGLEAIKNNNLNIFAECLNEYAFTVEEQKLCTGRTIELMNFLRKYKNVIGVKGCGAGLADAFIVLMDSVLSNQEMEKLKEEALQKGLRFIQQGIGFSKGLNECNKVLKEKV